jgi:phage terminase large subunit
VNTPPNSVKRMINYTENPFLSDTSRSIIEALKASDFDAYQHIYLGVPRTDDDNVIIRRSWIESAIDAHVVLKFGVVGTKRLGFDVADGGQDLCANVYAHGAVAKWSDEWKAGEDELLKSCTRTYREALKRGAEVTYDSIGVGASAGAKFAEINDAKTNGERVEYVKFNAGGQVFKPDAFYQPKTKNKDMFANIKAQAWWLVADRFRNTYNAVHHGEKFPEDQMISIASDMPHLDKLIDELSTPKRDFDQLGRVKVESKKDLAKREVPSPNLADAFIMAFAPTQGRMVISDALLRQA